jgi:hypothetical protein
MICIAWHVQTRVTFLLFWIFDSSVMDALQVPGKRAATATRVQGVTAAKAGSAHDDATDASLYIEV